MDATSNRVSTTPVIEQLHLHMKRTHWETCRHTDLGAHLQDALDALSRDGWEVVAAYAVDRTPEIILRRVKNE